MKKIWAVINLSADETAQNLLSALFSKEEFNPHNAILIEKKMVIAEVFFEEIPPQKMVEAIGGYRDVLCGFGEVSEECLKKGGKSSEDVYHKKVDKNYAPAENATQVVRDSSEHEEEASTEAVADEFVDAVSTEPVAEEKGGAVSIEAIAEENGEAVPVEAVTEDNGEPPTEPAGEASEDVASSTVPAVKSGRSKPRKAPEHIPEIDDIAQKCVSYEQFVSEVAKWLEVGKRESYLVDLFKVAATVEKLSWTPIEKELAKKGYSNPFAMRQRTSKDVTQKFAQVNIDCSFIALVEYVTKYKNYDFRPNIEAKVKQILSEMGIENEKTELQSEITQIAIQSVMVEEEHANMKDICTAAGCGKDFDTILDAKMNFSNFINKFLQKQGKKMATAEEFIGRLREAVYNGISIT